MASKLDPSAAAQKKIELFSGTYFAACTLGGVIGKLPLMHLTKTPLAPYQARFDNYLAHYQKLVPPSIQLAHAVKYPIPAA